MWDDSFLQKHPPATLSLMLGPQLSPQSPLCYCLSSYPSMAFITRIACVSKGVYCCEEKYHAQNQLGGKKSLFHHPEKSEQELKTGNEAEALEDWWLLACSVFLCHPGPSASGCTTHNVLGTPTSTINQENSKGIVTHSFNTSTQEEEAGRSLWILVQPGLYKEFQPHT